MKIQWLLAMGLSTLLCACGAHYYRSEPPNVALILRNHKAKEVHLHCSLDGFKPRRAERLSGRWEVLLPIERAFRYFYHIDGVPYVPDCALKELDDFGSENCIFDPGL